MTAIDLLKLEDKKRRRYRSQSVYIDAVNREIQRFQRRFPDEDWTSFSRVVSGVPGDGDYEIEVGHLIRWAAADVSKLERHWGIQLPDWMHHFYSYISEAAFTWRNLTSVMPLEEIIQVEDVQRRAEGIEDTPVRLVRFATVWLTGSHLALRQSVRMGGRPNSAESCYDCGIVEHRLG